MGIFEEETHKGKPQKIGPKLAKEKENWDV
jgi:hypothetical protein